MPNYLAQGVEPPDIAGSQRRALETGIALENRQYAKEDRQAQQLELMKKRIQDDLTGVYAGALLADPAQSSAIYEQNAAEFNRRYPSLQLPPSVASQQELVAGMARANPEMARALVQAKMKPQEPYTLAPGAQRRGPDGKVIAENPRAAAAQTQRWGAPVTETGADGKPIVVRYSNTGGRMVVEGARPVNKVSTGAPTEDERKAAGWFKQAENAYQNMEAVLREDPKADEPGFVETYSPIDEVANRSRSASRQRYAQAASSFAEAALRAATGAGVTIDEARQKIAELTPQRGDSASVRTQKRESLLVYLNSLQARAARALNNPAQEEIPQQPADYYGGYGPDDGNGQAILDAADAILSGQ